MGLNKKEKFFVEAIKSALDDDALGLHKFDSDKEVSHMQQFKYEDIRDMMRLKVNGLSFATEIMAAFEKNHSYKYTTDPSFCEGFAKDMKARGIPAKQQKTALRAVDSIVKDLECDEEADFGWNKDMDDLVDLTSNADNRTPKRSIPHNNKENLRATEINAKYDEIK